MYENIAGVVLAGGRSKRMGSDKALLQYKGKPLVEYMQDILYRSGFDNVYISGQLEGYECEFDDQPFSGPAVAIQSVINRMPQHKGFLFIPVDMPLLEPELLRLLVQQDESCYFENRPLPAFIRSGQYRPNGSDTSVKNILKKSNAKSLSVPEQYVGAMINANSPEDWKKVLES